MRSNRTGGSAWPDDMLLTVDEFPAPVMQLLYVRHAWGLESWMHVPELDPLPAVGSSKLPANLSREEAQQRWDAAWKQNTYWNLRAQGDYSDEFDVAAHFGIAGPLWWFREYGTDGIDVAAYEAWTRELDALRVDLFDSPERVAVEAAAEAWHRGLRTIYVMPFGRSGGAEWNGPHIMTVDARTRLDPEGYPAAFASQPA